MDRRECATTPAKQGNYQLFLQASETERFLALMHAGPLRGAISRRPRFYHRGSAVIFCG